mgnify:CR=1 FL=1
MKSIFKKLTGGCSKTEWQDYEEGSWSSELAGLVAELVRDLLITACTFEDKQRAIVVGITAWNIALTPKKMRESHMDMYMATTPFAKGSSEWEARKNVFRVLIRRKQEMFPKEKYMIVSVDFPPGYKWDDGELKVKLALKFNKIALCINKTLCAHCTHN